MSDFGTLDLARRAGELEGAAFEAALAARERLERSDRLSRIALTSDEADLPAADARSGSRRDLPELESQLAELVRFREAVLHSRSWKLMQRLLRLVGRGW